MGGYLYGSTTEDGTHVVRSVPRYANRKFNKKMKQEAEKQQFLNELLEGYSKFVMELEKRKQEGGQKKSK
jgi:hypothetical protein